MSKKKAFTGNTMTLKDFHGGSIPSDLPLPSAPGVIVRPADHRPTYDHRPTAWGNPAGRVDHRLRPNSSGSMRNMDDKAPFITSNIGRNFDEDERKPLDGPSGPRRTVSDESIRAPVSRPEPKTDAGRSGLIGPQVGGFGGSSYSARVVEGGHMSVSSRPLSSGGSRNAWGVRKEAVVVNETVASPWSGQSTVTKFAQASALDQISSGRWQTKPLHPQPDVEVIRQSESPSGLYGRGNDTFGGVSVASERDYHENALVRHVEKGLAIDEGVRGGAKEVPSVERVRSPVLLDGNERSSVLYTNDGQPAYPEGKHGGSESQQPPEAVERPKLKLLPRSKPLDITEPPAVDYKQGLQQPTDTRNSVAGSNVTVNASHVKPVLSSNEASHAKPVSSSSDAGNRLVERPKLNLKPRSQPIAQGKTERERTSLFGGARPREMVLKERGVDDVINSQDEVQAPSRTPKSDVVRSEVAPARANTSRHSERSENHPHDHRTARVNEKREQRADAQKADMQRKSWRNENWRNNRDSEKHQQQQERQPSPETWRKPVEQPNSANSDGSGLRFGKAVSAVELAQAFSKSVSEPKSVDQFSGQRGLPGHTQIPFSRLTGPATRPPINGY